MMHSRPRISRGTDHSSKLDMVLSGVVLLLVGNVLFAGEQETGWSPMAARDEIRPVFVRMPMGDSAGEPVLIIRHDQREGLQGHWQRTVPITGGEWYHFSAERQTTDVANPRRSAPVRLLWRDDEGNLVPSNRPTTKHLGRTWTPRVRADHPADSEPDANGSVTVSGTYQAPPGATRCVIELYLQWAPGGEVRWEAVSLQKTNSPPKRFVKLGTVHHFPSDGETREEKCRQYLPFIQKAAKQDVDLLVLGETITFYGQNRSPAEVAEPIPGPSTRYFAELAKTHDMYIVAGLYERDQHLIYNVAVLLGPDGSVVGKYRKVTLPRDEVSQGVTPGDTYPVFQTRFGKVGMMICYDGFFPEVARRLSNNGAEIIAFPVWGCNPLLAKARACENHVYVVSSTYTRVEHKWMISAIFDHTGEPLAQAKELGSIAVTEVDLNQPTNWRSLGDFRAHMQRHRPESGEEMLAEEKQKSARP